jgi:DMSO reductase anchor subunit
MDLVPLRRTDMLRTDLGQFFTLLAYSSIGMWLALTTKCDPMKNEWRQYATLMTVKLCGWIIGIGSLVAAGHVLLRMSGVVSF